MKSTTLSGQIESLPNGQWIVAGDTHLGAWAKQHGNIVSDPHLMKFLEPVVNADEIRTVWDIGANIGDHTRRYLDWGKTVVAVEPHPVAFACLEHNCPEAVCMNIAASGESGRLNFHAADNVGASRVDVNGESSVPADTLDNVFRVFSSAEKLRRYLPDFIKIDVEGWEIHVLRGLRETIWSRKPVVFIEINQGALAANGFDAVELTNFFRSCGYTRFDIYPVDARPEDPQYDLLIRP